MEAIKTKVIKTAAQLESLQSARAAFTEKGVSPRERRHEKIILAVLWVYKFGYSSPFVINLICGGKTHAFAHLLIKKGILVATRTASGGAVLGVPAVMLTLSKIGLSLAVQYAQVALEYQEDAYRINQDYLRHGILIQSLTAQRLIEGRISGYITESERMVSEKSTGHKKQHDIVWINKLGERYGVEIELTGKWSHKLDHFVWSCVESLSPRAGAHQVIQVLIFTDADALVEHYKTAFKEGAEIKKWIQDKTTKKQVVSEKGKIDKETSQSIIIKNVIADKDKKK